MYKQIYPNVFAFFEVAMEIRGEESDKSLDDLSQFRSSSFCAVFVLA